MASLEAQLPVPQEPRDDVLLNRISLPFAMVLAFGCVLVAAGYTAGGIMSGLTRDKSEMESRLASIDKEIAAIKSILAERVFMPSQQSKCRTKS